MQTVGGHPIQVCARDFEDRDTGIGCQSDGLGEPLVGLGAERDVERGSRNTGAQTFQHRITAQHGLDLVALAFGGPVRLRLVALRGRMVRPQVCRRSGAAAFQPAAPLATGTDRRPLLATCFTHRSAALRITGHRRGFPTTTAGRRWCR
jgi:hypothetical protein